MKKILLSVIIALSLFACNRDDAGDDIEQESTDQEFLANFGNEVERDFTGTLLTYGDQPVEGALVTINNKTAVSNAEGVFTINTAIVRERFAYVKVEHQDYFLASRSLVPTSGINNTVIRMIPKEFQYQVQSSEEKTVGNSLASVTLQGNYVTENGDIYTGTVDVAIYYLFTTLENLEDYMPGMLLGRTENDESNLLKTYGMLLVELQGSNGESLNLAENSPATIKMNLDGSQVGNAPTTIPLWFFDEEQGYWKEEGQAILEGNAYIGEVSHFSFWNCDIPVEAIYLTINLLSLDGNPLINQEVKVVSENNGTGYGITDNLGQVSGLVPSNQDLVFEAFGIFQQCQDFFYTEMIGSFNEDTEATILTDIPNTDASAYERTITGNLLNCDGNPVTLGYVKLFYDDLEFQTSINNGNFTFDIYQCGDITEFQLIGYDIDGITFSSTANFNLDGVVTNVGQISTCNDIEEYAKFEIDNVVETTYFTTFPHFVRKSFYLNNENGFISIIADATGNDYRLNFFGSIGTGPFIGEYGDYDYGTPEAQGFEINHNHSTSGDGVEPPYISHTNNNIVYNLIELGNIGEYISVDFEGDYEDPSGNPHTIEGSIRVIREE